MLQAYASVSQDFFFKVGTIIEKTYQSEFKKIGYEFIVKKYWLIENESIGIHHDNEAGEITLRMEGGVGRAKLMTKRGLVLIACHEVGHFLGGYPLNKRGTSNEGQADYFATSKCMRKLAVSSSDLMNELAQIKSADAGEAMLLCTQQFSKRKEQQVCKTSIIAALEYGSYYLNFLKRKAKVYNSPNYKGPDYGVRYYNKYINNVKSVSLAKSTDGPAPGVASDEHPDPQCRVDTFVQGSLCNRPTLATESVDRKSELGSACHIMHGDTVGTRPSCWFQSQINNKLLQ